MKKLYKLNGLDLDQMLLNAGMSERWIDRHKVKYEMFITKLLFKTIFNPGKKYKRLSMEEMRSKLGKVRIDGQLKWLVYVIRDHLKSENVILSYTSQLEKKTKGSFFKFSDEILEEGWSKSDTVINADLTNRMDKVVEYSGVYSKIQSVIMKIDLDFEAAKTFLDEALLLKMKIKSKKMKGVYVKRKMNKRIYSHWLMALEVIKYGLTNPDDEDFQFHVDLQKTGRVYHIIACLPKPLRKFLRINGKPFIELDIKNCQPLLFVPSLKSWAKKNGCLDAPDILLYQELCQKGKFYNHIKELIEKTGLEIKFDYQEFKQEFFGRIFFSTEKKRYKWRMVFEEHFPNVSKCISSMKSSDYKKLSVTLQKQESDLIVLNVCKKLYGNGIKDIFPLHDAIYCTEDSLDEAIAQIFESFEEYGLVPSVEPNRLVKQLLMAA